MKYPKILVALVCLSTFATIFYFNFLEQANFLVKHSKSMFLSAYESKIINNFGTNINLELDVDRQKDAPDSELKYILYWNKRYDRDERFMFGLGREAFYQRKCPETRCVTTVNRTLMNIEDFDALFFHTWVLKMNDLPKKRSPMQRYVAHTTESPQRYHHKQGFFKGLNGYFNWTLTYRMDSDFHFPYGRILKIKEHPIGADLDEYITEFGLNNQHLLQNKTKDIAWIVSNCKTITKREKIVEKLIKEYGLQIDIYGKCGPLDCPGEGTKDCLHEVARNYLFYLSFENSICGDYLTEKLFKPIQMEVPIVPITYNGGDMEHLAPAHSHINALNFANLTDLAAYINKVKEDKALWTSFFWWKDFYTVRATGDDRVYDICEICAALHNTSMPNKVYTDFEDWWVKKAHCNIPELA